MSRTQRGSEPNEVSHMAGASHEAQMSCLPSQDTRSPAIRSPNQKHPFPPPKVLKCSMLIKCNLQTRYTRAHIRTTAQSNIHCESLNEAEKKSIQYQTASRIKPFTQHSPSLFFRLYAPNHILTSPPSSFYIIYKCLMKI